MKKKLLLLLLPVVCLLCSGLIWYYAFFDDTVQKNTATKPKKNQVMDIPLFVITGFGAAQHTISFDSLKKAYCAGKILVLPSLKAGVDNLLGCANNAPTLDLNSFGQSAKSNVGIVSIEELRNQFKALNIDGLSFFENPEKYPLLLKKDLPFDTQKQITKFMHTGCSAITRNTGLAADAHGVAFITKGVVDYFKDADLTHFSNEVSIRSGCVYLKYDPAYRFCTKERDFQALLDLGVDIVELTGNHNKDFGAEPYRITLEWYKKNNMQVFGGGASLTEAQKPLIITLKDSKKMAFVGFNESCPLGECATATQSGANRYNRLQAEKTITDLKKRQKIDIVFASVQFNEADSYSPTATQNTISRDLIDFGADLVNGSQAHQVQKIEFYKGKPIFHGLGNFLFDQVHRIGVRQSYFLTHYLYEGRIIQSIPTFTFISDERIPVIATLEQECVMRAVVFEDKLLYK
jgi:hypothetical protein